MIYTGLVERLRNEAGKNGGDGAYAWNARELCAKAADAIEALTRPVDVEAVARAMAASQGLDWDGKAKGTEYANHGYWLPLAQAALAAMETPHADG